MRGREGLSIVETLVVIAIIGVLLGFLLPAVQTARTRALEVVCKNNLRQVNLAVADYYETHKWLPRSGDPRVADGWTVDVLPFLEQLNLHQSIAPRTAIESAPDFLLRQPKILTCPMSAGEIAATSKRMERSSYVLVPGGGRGSYSLIDAPIETSVPWASGPEMSMKTVLRLTGPHNRGFFVTGGLLDGVHFVPGNQPGP